MLQRLLGALALLGLGWLLSRMIFGSRRRPAARRPRAERLSSQGSMVRDRVCNTFLPRSQAIAARVGGEEQFFCSEACRDRFLADARVVASAPAPDRG